MGKQIFDFALQASVIQNPLTMTFLENNFSFLPSDIPQPYAKKHIGIIM